MPVEVLPETGFTWPLGPESQRCEIPRPAVQPDGLGIGGKAWSALASGRAAAWPAGM